MIRKNKWKCVVSSLLVLLPVLFGAEYWGQLPNQIPTHWGFSGEVDGWSSKAFAVFVLPLILLATHWLCIGITAADPKNKGQNRKAINLVFWAMPLTSLLVNGLMYATILGISFDMMSAMLLLFGVMFLAIGNYLPKCKQNYTIGVRVPWTLNNEENWNKTHRLCGKMWVAGGMIMLFCAFLPTMIQIPLFLITITVITVIPIVYSYLYYKEQQKQGKTQLKDKAEVKFSKLYWSIAAVITLATVVFVGVLCFTGSITVQYAEQAVVVEASYWSDLTIEYQDIQKVEYWEQWESGLRTGGFGSPKLSMGAFKNDTFGNYTRYTYNSCEACVVLTVDDKIIVLNGKDVSSTQQMYQELLAKTE